jgi:hypothetical protein
MTDRFISEYRIGDTIIYEGDIVGLIGLDALYGKICGIHVSGEFFIYTTKGEYQMSESEYGKTWELLRKK